MDVAKLLGDRVRERRVALDLTQDPLAARVGTSNDEISRIERGVREPRFSTIERLASALGLQVADLFRRVAAHSSSAGGGRKPAPQFGEVVEELRRLPKAQAEALATGLIASARVLRRGHRE